MNQQQIRADFWANAQGVRPAVTFGGDVTPAGCVPAYNFGGNGPDGDVDDPKQCPNCSREKAIRKPLCPDCLEAAQF